jgi:hypothetical protein
VFDLTICSWSQILNWCSSYFLYDFDLRLSRAWNNWHELFLQLRNLVWATSKHDVYLMSHFSVLHWSALSGMDTELMNVKGHVAPREVWYMIVVYHLSNFFTSSTGYLVILLLLILIWISYYRSTLEVYWRGFLRPKLVPWRSRTICW